MTKTIYEPAYIALVDRLRRRRRELKLRQEDVAARLGVNRNWISKIERREVRLDVLQCVRLCIALDLNATETLRPFVDEVRNETSQ